MPGTAVTTSNLLKHFGELADKALTEPITITRNGRERLVLLSADEYQRLKRRDRQVYRIEDLPPELVAAIATSEPAPECDPFTNEYQRKP